MRGTRRIQRAQGIKPAEYNTEVHRWRGHTIPRSLGTDPNFFRKHEQGKRDRWRLFSRAPRPSAAEREYLG